MVDTPNGRPAGWYDDGTGQFRWWDGAAWTIYAPSTSAIGTKPPGGWAVSPLQLVSLVAAILAVVGAIVHTTVIDWVAVVLGAIAIVAGAFGILDARRRGRAGTVGIIGIFVGGVALIVPIALLLT